MPTDTKVQTPNSPDCPRVEAVIDQAMRKHPKTGAYAQAAYFEAVHQELAPLARTLERELTALTAELEEARKQLAAANAKTLELAQQLHREQVRASRANPFVDRD